MESYEAQDVQKLRNLLQKAGRALQQGSGSEQAHQTLVPLFDELLNYPSLPAAFTQQDIADVTAILISLIASKNVGKDTKARTIQTVLSLARSDKRIFDTFRPRPELLEKLKLHEYCMDEDTSLSSLACDMVSFMLRYNPQIDYVTFSTNADFVRQIRRYENVKYANELEHLTIKIADLDRRVGGGAGGHIDETYLEARIHDKVREAVELSALGGDNSLTKIESIEQSSIVAYYQRTLQLMQDMEQRVKQENRENLLDTVRQV